MEDVRTSRDWLFSSDYKILRLPRSVVHSLELQHALLADFFATNLGFLTKVYGHKTARDTFDENIVIVCLDGRGWYEALGQRWTVEQGQVLFVHSSIPHAYGSDADDPWSIQWAHFRGLAAPGYLDLINVTPDRPVRTIGIHPELSMLFAEALKVMGSGYSLYHLLRISTLVQQALAHIAFLTAYTPPHGSLGLHVGQVIEYMVAHINRPCTLDEFAAEACLSRSYFSRQFREKTGYAPVDYFIRLKMQRACELLETTQMTVGDISRSLGYQDQYYFSRLFKKIVGAHPTQYRQTRGVDH
jgi:AraC-like DNA-binding protein